MKKTLLYLDENLQSSIALRYADYLSGMMDIDLHIIHVEETDSREQAGTGWVRRSWEAGVVENGMQAINRLIKTEKIKCRITGSPLIMAGDKEFEVLSELRRGNYELYMEGHLDTGNIDRFFDVISAKRYQQTSCPKLMVKNLTVSDKIAILLGDDVDHEKLARVCLILGKGSKFSVEIVYFKFREQAGLDFNEGADVGAIRDVIDIVEQAGLPCGEKRVICGTPEQAGDFLRNYAFIASTLPVRKSFRMEVMAQCPASLLLC